MQVGHVMTKSCKLLNANDTLQKAAQIMHEDDVGILPVEDHTLENLAEIQVRRLPVINQQKRPVGIILLGDAARVYSPEPVGIALSGVVMTDSVRQALH